MLNENARKWVAALRSGNYPQAKHYLFNGTGYCCLGVACVLAGITPDMKNRFQGELHYLPETVRESLGLRTVSGLFGSESSHDEKETLAGLNDAGKTFAEIADFIEQHESELFITVDSHAS